MIKESNLLKINTHTKRVSMYSPQSPENTAFELGHRYYELSNHLGNVLTVISDVKTPVSSGGNIESYTANIVNIADYSPFGVQLDGRTISSDGYRYGFQGQEKDDEVKGEGNSLNYKYRMHDPRIGRFFAVDPYDYKFVYYSPYQFGGNSVIISIELEGLESSVIINYPEKTIEIKKTKENGFAIDKIQLRELQGHTSAAPPAHSETKLTPGGHIDVKCLGCNNDGSSYYIRIKLPSESTTRMIPHTTEGSEEISHYEPQDEFNWVEHNAIDYSIKGQNYDNLSVNINGTTREQRMDILFKTNMGNIKTNIKAKLKANYNLGDIRVGTLQVNYGKGMDKSEIEAYIEKYMPGVEISEWNEDPVFTDYIRFNLKAFELYQKTGTREVKVIDQEAVEPTTVYEEEEVAPIEIKE